MVLKGDRNSNIPMWHLFDGKESMGMFLLCACVQLDPRLRHWMNPTSDSFDTLGRCQRSGSPAMILTSSRCRFAYIYIQSW